MPLRMQSQVRTLTYHGAEPDAEQRGGDVSGANKSSHCGSCAQYPSMYRTVEDVVGFWLLHAARCSTYICSKTAFMSA